MLTEVRKIYKSCMKYKVKIVSQWNPNNLLRRRLTTLRSKIPL